LSKIAERKRACRGFYFVRSDFLFRQRRRDRPEKSPARHLVPEVGVEPTRWSDPTTDFKSVIFGRIRQ